MSNMAESIISDQESNLRIYFPRGTIEFGCSQLNSSQLLMLFCIEGCSHLLEPLLKFFRFCRKDLLVYSLGEITFSWLERRTKDNIGRVPTNFAWEGLKNLIDLLALHLDSKLFMVVVNIFVEKSEQILGWNHGEWLLDTRSKIDRIIAHTIF